LALNGCTVKSLKPLRCKISPLFIGNIHGDRQTGINGTCSAPIRSRGNIGRPMGVENARGRRGVAAAVLECCLFGNVFHFQSLFSSLLTRRSLSSGGRHRAAIHRRGGRGRRASVTGFSTHTSQPIPVLNHSTSHLVRFYYFSKKNNRYISSAF